MSRFCMIVLGASLIGVVACSKSDEHSAGGAERAGETSSVDSKACAIVTKADVEGVLGQVFDVRGGDDDPGSASTCVYHFLGRQSGAKDMLAVSLHASDIATVKRSAGVIEPVHEFGGDAFWGGFATLYAGKQNRTVTLTLGGSGLSKAESRAKVIELARKGVGRL